MRSIAVSTLLLAASLMACGGSSSSSSSSSPQTGDEQDITEAWQSKLTCDSGAAVLDADQADAKSLQFVIRDKNIVTFLSSKVNHIQNVRGEVIVEGRAQSPVTDGSAFTSLVDDALHFDASSNFNGTVQKRVIAEVTRDGGDRLKFAFSEITTTRTCSGYIEEVYCRNGSWTQKDDKRELANWSFQTCR